MHSSLPTFLVIGSMKAGTTSLYEYLRAHPHVYMPPHKELDFFVREGNLSRGLDWYEEQFTGAEAALAVGEASTSYTKYPIHAGVAERVSRVLPDVRLIYVIRNPIERIRSQFVHEWLLGEQHLSFEAAVTTEPRYVEFSRYATQIAEYMRYFRRDDLLIVEAERLRESRENTLQMVYRFIGVDSSVMPENVESEFHRSDGKRLAPPLARKIVASHAYQGAGRYIPRAIKRRARSWLVRSPNPPEATLTPTVHELLAARLRDDVSELRAFLGADFHGWGIA
jgi:hypothetical protein